MDSDGPFLKCIDYIGCSDGTYRAYICSIAGTCGHLHYPYVQLESFEVNHLLECCQVDQHQSLSLQLVGASVRNQFVGKLVAAALVFIIIKHSDYDVVTFRTYSTGL